MAARSTARAAAATARYRRLEARRWFTVFFIPVIPLKQLGTVVQCDSCGGQFGDDVLQRTHLGRPGRRAWWTPCRAAAFAFVVLRRHARHRPRPP